MEESNLNSNEIIKEEDKYTLVKPPLYKRLFSGLIDLALFLVLFIGIELGSFYTIFRAMGYESSINEAQTMLKESNLFVYSEENGYVSKLDEYSEKKIPLLDLDEAITSYYTTSYPSSLNKLNQYNEDKVETNLFTLNNDGTFTLNVEITDEKLVTFLTEQFNEAMDIFYSNPQYVNASNKSKNIITFGSLIILVISSGVVYLIIPLFTKYKVTIGEMIFKFALANSTTDKLATKGDVAKRSAVFIVFNILATFLLFLVAEYICFIPIFITLAMMCFTKKFLTPHDYISNTYIVTKDALDHNLHDKLAPKDEDKKKKKKYGLNHI